MTEHELRRQTSAYLKQRDGWWLQKIADKFTGGLPDYLGTYKGRMVALELKIKPNKPTPLQRITGQAIQHAGGIYQVVYSFDEVRQWVAMIEQHHQRFIKNTCQ